MAVSILQPATRYLTKRDPVLKHLIRKVGALDVSGGGQLYPSLITSILSQQLSIKAADTIIGRFRAAHGGRFPPPAALIRATPTQLRRHGISRQKAGYLNHLARTFASTPMTPRVLHPLSDDEVIERLTVIKGVGTWTAKMILIFTMGRPDVLPHEDLGFRMAVKQFYKMRKDPTERTLVKLSESWKPYRSVAARYLWRARDQKS